MSQPFVKTMQEATVASVVMDFSWLTTPALVNIFKKIILHSASNSVIIQVHLNSIISSTKKALMTTS